MIKITLDRAELSAILADGKKVIPSRSALQVLACVKIDAGKDGIDFTTSDFLTRSHTHLSITPECEGSVAIVCDKLLGIVNAMRGEKVTISQAEDGGEAVVSDGLSKYRLLTMDSNEFPKSTDDSLVDESEISSDDLRKAIAQTEFAVMHVDQHTALTGILFECEEFCVKLVATDRIRMAIAQKTAKCLGEKFSFILPARSAALLKDYCRGEKCVISRKGKNIMFKFGNFAFETCTQNAAFPNYNQVVNGTRTDKSLEFDTREFIGLVKRTALVCSDASKEPITLEISTGKIKASSHSVEIGEAEEEMASSYVGDDVTIRFSPAMLLEALTRVDQPTVQFEFTADGPATKFHCGDTLYIQSRMR